MRRQLIRYSEEIADEIIERLSKGESLRAICRADHLPDESTVRYWADEDCHGFTERYVRARDEGLDYLADEVLSIADNSTGDTMRDRLRFDARRWYLSKLAPKRYGDRLQLSGDKDAPITVNVVRFGDHDPE